MLLISLCSCSNNQQFFKDFDEVTYFHLKSIDYKNDTDSIALKVIYDEFPTELKDNKFIEEIEKNKFVKLNFNQKDVQKLKEIFTEKLGISFSQNACAPIFRDILILKLKGNIVGIAKICLQCEKYYFVGYNHNINVDSFGKNNEFDDLNKIFRKYKN